MAAGTRPQGCWRPYSESSPWNTPVDSDVQLDPRSKQLATEVGTPANVIAGWEGTSRDYARPVYFSKPGDPIYLPVCTGDLYGECPVQDLRVAIPKGAEPAAGGDGHLTVVDPLSGWEYDFWQVSDMQAGGGELRATWGGHSLINGYGLGGDRNSAVAWGGPTAAVLLRAEEIEAGAVNHALLMIIPCTNGEPVYPARHDGQECPPAQRPDAPAMGQRFRLNMTDAQINALGVPTWKKVVLRGMAHYGMIVGDTGGGATGWGIQWESGSEYTSLGRVNEWDTLARNSGIRPQSGGEYVFNLRDDVKWAKYLQVVDPCMSSATCGNITLAVPSIGGVPAGVAGLGVSDNGSPPALPSDLVHSAAVGQCSRVAAKAKTARSTRVRNELARQSEQCQNEVERLLSLRH